MSKDAAELPGFDYRDERQIHVAGLDYWARRAIMRGVVDAVSRQALAGPNLEDRQRQYAALLSMVIVDRLVKKEQARWSAEGVSASSLAAYSPTFNPRADVLESVYAWYLSDEQGIPDQAAVERLDRATAEAEAQGATFTHGLAERLAADEDLAARSRVSSSMSPESRWGPSGRVPSPKEARYSEAMLGAWGQHDPVPSMLSDPILATPRSGTVHGHWSRLPTSIDLAAIAGLGTYAHMPASSPVQEYLTRKRRNLTGYRPKRDGLVQLIPPALVIPDLSTINLPAVIRATIKAWSEELMSAAQHVRRQDVHRAVCAQLCLAEQRRLTGTEWSGVQARLKAGRTVSVAGHPYSPRSAETVMAHYGVAVPSAWEGQKTYRVNLYRALNLASWWESGMYRNTREVDWLPPPTKGTLTHFQPDGSKTAW